MVQKCKYLACNRKTLPETGQTEQFEVRYGQILLEQLWQNDCNPVSAGTDTHKEL